MNIFHTGTLYYFEDRNTGGGILETTDSRIVAELANGNAIETGRTVTIKEENYKIHHIAIVPVADQGKPNKRKESSTIGEINEYTIQAIFYVTKEK